METSTTGPGPACSTFLNVFDRHPPDLALLSHRISLRVNGSKISARGALPALPDGVPI